MTDRFKGDVPRQDYTFYSMSKKKNNDEKEKDKFSTGNWLFCSRCGANPIIKVDNAKQYICEKCLPKYFKGKTNWNLKKK